jgi:pimeloyl-ACP methyl ester carboxylesterase
MTTYRDIDAAPADHRVPATQPAPRGSRSARIPGLHHGFVRVADDVRLHYTVTGAGEPVLLLPGWPQSWYTWRHMIPPLTDAGRQVYAIDPRGFGDSDMPATGYDLDTLAHDIHTFIDRLDLAGPHGLDVIAHDTGSWIAHALAANHPDDIRRLVLSDAYIPGVSPDPPAGYPDITMVHRQWHFYFNRVEGLPEALIHGREREFLSWFFGPAKIARTWAIDADTFEEYLRVFSKPGAVRAGLMYYREVFSPRGRLASTERKQTRLEMPILTLGGEYADADNLLHTMRPLARHVAGHVFTEVGHHLPEECPDEMVRAILNFWTDCEGMNSKR